MPTDPLAKPFSDWTLSDAQAAIANAIEAGPTKDGYDANKALAEKGDHWNNGAIVPHSGDSSLRPAQLKALEPEQAPVDTANEVLDNATNGLCGTEATVTFPLLEAIPDAPKGASKAALEAVQAERAKAEAIAADMLAAVSGWWDVRGFWPLMWAACRRARWAMRGPARAWVPQGALVDGAPVQNEDGTTTTPRVLPSGLAFRDALALIALEAPAPDTAHVYTQPATQRKVAILTTTDDGQTVAELWYADGADLVCRVVRSGGEQETEPLRLPKLGYLPLTEITAPLLLTESVRFQQRQLDLTSGIILGRTMQAAGFRGRYTLNAQPTGVWSRTKPTDSPAIKTHTDEGGAWYYVETPRIMGPAMAQDLTGELNEETSTDSSGTTTVTRTLASPGVVIEEPVDPDFAIKTAEYRRACILRDCKQGHLALVAKGEASGVAYAQARAVFAADLENARPALERAVRDLLAFVIALADLMTADGDPLKGFLSRYRIHVQARVNAGPLTPEERTQIMAEWKDGAVSWATTAARLGIEDVASEREALDRDPMARLAFLEKAAQTMTAVAAIPGGSVESAARALKAAGLDAALVDALMPRDSDGVVEEDGDGDGEDEDNPNQQRIAA